MAHRQTRTPFQSFHRSHVTLTIPDTGFVLNTPHVGTGALHKQILATTYTCIIMNTSYSIRIRNTNITFRIAFRCIQKIKMLNRNVHTWHVTCRLLQFVIWNTPSTHETPRSIFALHSTSTWYEHVLRVFWSCTVLDSRCHVHDNTYHQNPTFFTDTKTT